MSIFPSSFIIRRGFFSFGSEYPVLGLDFIRDYEFFEPNFDGVMNLCDCLKMDPPRHYTSTGVGWINFECWSIPKNPCSMKLLGDIK